MVISFRKIFFTRLSLNFFFRKYVNHESKFRICIAQDEKQKYQSI